MSDDENPKNVKTHLLQQCKERDAQKRIYSAFMRDAEEVRDGNNSCLVMKKVYLKKETEGLIMAAQGQLLQARRLKHCIDRTTNSSKCKICGKMNENVNMRNIMNTSLKKKWEY